MIGLETEEEAETVRGEVSKMRMVTATTRVSKRSGAGPLLGSTEAGGGDTWVVTSKVADEAGVGFCHGTKPGERERVAGRW